MKFETMEEKNGESLQRFNERRVFRIQSEVSGSEIRIPGHEMGGLIERLRMASDKEQAVNKKQKKKDGCESEACRCFH
jgi:hypothetical protein